jgi:pyrroline-5-carboxylate reductase
METPMATNCLRIGFLGAGKMATTLTRGWIEAKLTQADVVVAGDPVEAIRASFTRETSAAAVSDNRQVVAASDVLILAVKPQHMMTLLDEIQPLLTARHLVVSIAAGITLEQISGKLGPHTRLVRVMPNAPCQVGASASAYAGGPGASADDLALVDRLLNSVGRALPVPEKLLDAVTGLSGSGPAYVFVMIEALSDGGVRMGLPRDVATLLAAQTVFGAAKMLLDTGLHAGALKDLVASPGGTTMAGLHEIERGGLRGILMDAVEAATLRAAELAEPRH